MCDLLSREKEFLKLNEELNVKTKVLLEKPNMSKENRPIVNTARPTGMMRAQSPKSGKPPIKPKILINKANTVPRNCRQLTAPIVSSARGQLNKPKNNDGGNATYRVSKTSNKNAFKIANERNNTAKTNFRSDEFTVCEIYRNENFENLPSVDENSIRSEIDLVVKNGKSPVSSPGRSSISTFMTNRKSSSSQCSFLSSSTGESLHKKNLSSDGLVRFLKSKVAILESELKTSSHELTKKAEELEKSLELQKRIESQRDYAISKNNNLTAQVGKMEGKLSDIEQKLKEREVEITMTSREMESLKREMRVMTQTNANLEKRLFRANEELENVKNTLACVKEADRELQESMRKEKEEHARQLRLLKKQKNELMTAYKKQIYLLDNLKRQTVCLEQARLISFAEKEFTKVLEWNAKN